MTERYKVRKSYINKNMNMTTIFKKTVILASFCFFLLPFFVAAVTLVGELNFLEQQVVILEAEIARSEQGVPGSLSKQELLRQYQTLQDRIRVVSAQISEVPAPAPSINIISPTQGQRIEGKEGTSFSIQWRTENWADGALANVDLIRQADGVTVLRRTNVLNENNRISLTTVNINTNATTTKTYKARVSAASNPSVSAESGWFTIAPPTVPGSGGGTGVGGGSGNIDGTVQPSITVLSPNGGEPWIFGEKQKISWVKDGIIPPKAVIAAYIFKGDQMSAFPYSGYAKDDKKTGDMPPNSGYFEWTVPTNSSVPFIRQGGGDYRIKVVIAVDGKIIARDVSDSPFTISASTAGGGDGQHVATPPNQLPTTVLYPNGGENITQGQLAVIQWKSELPDTFNYNLTLLDARGETVIREIDSNRPKGKYAWYIPSDIPPGQYRLRISGSGSLSSDTSNSAFTIVAQQIAVSQVTAPRSNQPPIVKSIAGPTSVVAGSQNTWTIVATDPDGTYVSISTKSLGADLNFTDYPKWYSALGTDQSYAWTVVFKEPGTYPVIVTAKDGYGVVSAEATILLTVTPSETRVTMANSPTVPAGIVAPGTEKTLGAFDMTVVGEPVSVDIAYISVRNGDPKLFHDFYLYDENGVKFEQRVDDTRGPAFPRPKIVFPVGTHTYTVKGTVEPNALFGTTVTLGMIPTIWNNTVGATTGRPITMPPDEILLSQMTVRTSALGFSATRIGTVRSPTVASGTKEVPIALYKLDGGAIEEDVRVSSLPLLYDDYNTNINSVRQLEACRLSADGEPLMSGANIVTPPVGPFSGGSGIDILFTLDSPLVVSKGSMKELMLVCDVASAAVGRFSFGVGAGAATAVGVSSGASVTVSKGIGTRGAIFTISSPTSFIGSDSLLANILAGLRSLFQQSD